MTPIHKNVHEDIQRREMHKFSHINTHTHRQKPAEAWSVRSGLDNVPLNGGRQYSL